MSIALLRAGCKLTVLLDNAAQADAVAQASRAAGIAIPVLIEIDSDGHRSRLILTQAHQEHGVIARHPDFDGGIPDFAVGT